jgi:hypothetical protein
MAAKFSDTGMVAIVRHNGLYYPVRAYSFNVTAHADGRATIQLEGSIDRIVGYASAEGVCELPPAPKQIEGTVA